MSNPLNRCIDSSPRIARQSAIRNILSSCGVAYRAMRNRARWHTISCGGYGYVHWALACKVGRSVRSPPADSASAARRWRWRSPRRAWCCLDLCPATWRCVDRRSPVGRVGHDGRCALEAPINPQAGRPGQPSARPWRRRWRRAPDTAADSRTDYRTYLLVIRALERHGAPCVLALDEVERLRRPEAVAWDQSAAAPGTEECACGGGVPGTDVGLESAMFALERAGGGGDDRGAGGSRCLTSRGSSTAGCSTGSWPRWSPTRRAGP